LAAANVSSAYKKYFHGVLYYWGCRAWISHSLETDGLEIKPNFFSLLQPLISISLRRASFSVENISENLNATGLRIFV